MALCCILTCEHAGNEIPGEYAFLFAGKEDVLYSHKAIDFGAGWLARHLARRLGLPLYSVTTSRLLVEGNRSLGTQELFSPYTKELAKEEKQALLEKYYFPHRREVEAKIQEETAAGHQVLHLAIHTFTPALEGEVRPAEVGILYDPERSLEERLAHQLKAHLQEANPERKVLFNQPYPGSADGFPTHLRGKFDQNHYAGFELEVNQKFFLNGDEEAWRQVLEEITQAVQAVLQAGQA
ncbi:N-formylglutamate amidohydrolase [Rufibacter psychrotolerans]|uniref:N-formylglutamate amidohydrolase n=1 Tax=Rufibacter psychrotolerans TaxID=2812556 RepID=UPI0019671BB1|nr:N-formylglutamate amidohydrolase [Rufibacter sp. SYSU D00308]